MSFHRATLIALLLCCSTCFAESPSDFVVDCSKNSRINRTTRAVDLIKMFGGSNTINGQIRLANGQTAAGTIIFPGVPKKRIDVIWGDHSKARPTVVRIFAQDTVWKTTGEIGIGATLKQLQTANAKPFILSGFSGDSAGVVTSWQNGKLDGGEPGCKIGASFSYLDSTDAKLKRSLAQIQTSRKFLSSTPAMQAANPRVSQIWISFWNP